MSDEPQNELERSLARAVTDPSWRPQFYRDLLAADIYFVRGGEPPEGSEETDAGEAAALRLAPVELERGPYLLVFSSVQRLEEELRSGAGYVRMNARTFLETTRGADVYLVAGPEYGKELTTFEIAALLDGTLGEAAYEYTVGEDARPAIATIPATRYPRELVEALTRLFERKPDVERAWAVNIFIRGRTETLHTLVVLEVAVGYEAVLAEAGMIAQIVAVPDPPVDFMQVTPERGTDFLETADLFYQRR